MWRDSDGLVSYGRGACARVGDLLGGLNGVALRCERGITTEFQDVLHNRTPFYADLSLNSK
jgi:hypothetical protein